MKIFHGVLKVALSLTVLALGLFLLANALGFSHPIGDFMFNDKLGRFLVGIASVFLVLLYWLTAVPARNEHYLSFDGEGGTVSLSIKAINEFLSKLTGEFAGIAGLRADVSADRSGKIEARLEISVKVGTAVQQLSQALQQRVRETLRDNLGIAEVHSVRIIVNRIVGIEPAGRVSEPEHSEWQGVASSLPGSE